jgi:L-arabinose transport system permease protein
MKTLWKRGGMAVVALACFVIFALAVPGFVAPGNLADVLVAVSTVGIVGCTMLFCLAAGDVDLSVGSTVALAGVLAGLLLQRGFAAPVAVLVPLLAGALIGLVNGIAVARLGVNALIATLATMQIVRGLAYLASDGGSVGISDANFTRLGQLKLGVIQSPVLFMTLFFVVFGLLLNKTIFGRNTLAVGGNSQAAHLAGIDVIKTRIGIFVLQGVAAALAGVLLASRVSSGTPRSGEGLELAVISGCVLGGVSLTGGVGSISGMIAGVLIMGMVKNAMDLKNVPTFWQMVASGGILLAAVLLDRWKNRRA